METKLLSIGVFISAILLSANLCAQNISGTLTFNFSTLNQGETRCVMAVCIENNASLFIKTKMQGPKSISWNGTKVAGAVVADGVYKV